MASGIVSFFTWVGLVASVTFLVSFWSLVLRARLVLGEWSPPSDAGLAPLHTHVVFVSRAVTLWIVPIGIALLAIGIAVPRLRRRRAFVAAFLTSAALAAATVFLDPLGWMTWLGI